MTDVEYQKAIKHYQDYFIELKILSPLTAAIMVSVPLAFLTYGIVFIFNILYWLMSLIAEPQASFMTGFVIPLILILEYGSKK